MHPILIHFPDAWPLIGGMNLYTYGALVATAFLVAILWTLHEAKVAGYDRDKVADLTFYLIIAAIVGSRLLYVLVELRHFLSRPLAVFKIWEGGLVFYGGLLACIAISWWYTRRHAWSLKGTADLFMPGVALGHAIGRIGCLMAGCCYGLPVADSPWWGLTFPHLDATLAPAGIPLYPTQLMESAVELLLFGILVWRRRHKRFEGQVFLTYLILYAAARSVLEIFRGDTIRGFVIPGILSTSQFISALVIMAAIIYYAKLRRHKEAR